MPNPYVEQVDLGGTTYDIHDAEARQQSASAYKTTDSADTTINDDDYIPMCTNDGATKKKTLFSNLLSKIKNISAHTGTGTAVTDTIAADTSLDNIVGTLLNNDKAIDTKATRGTSYPKHYLVSGQILNESGGNTAGHGVASVLLFPNGVAVVTYQCMISTAGASTTNYAWGINRDLIRALNSNIPVITPVTGGTVTWYQPASGGVFSGFNTTYNGYGCTHSPNGSFWNFARNYNGSSIGAFSSNAATLNSRMHGICIGTFTLT